MDNNNEFVEKKIIELLMPKFDAKLSQKMVTNSIFMKDQMENFTIEPKDFNIQIKSIRNISCFRIRFSLPTYLLFHISMKNLRKIRIYYKINNSGTLLSLLPVYNCNLNHLTLFRSYSKAIEWADATSDEESDYICNKFSNEAGEPMEQSSLNFLLQNKSKPYNVSVEESEIIAKAFEFLYWRIPLNDMGFGYSTIHNFIYHNSSKIISTRSIFKTLVRIKYISSKRYITELPSKTQYVHAKAQILCQDEDRLFFKEIGVLVSEPDASRIKPDMLINAVMDKPILYKQRNLPIMIHGIIGEGIDLGDYRCLIAVILWKRLQATSDNGLCLIGESDSVMQQVEDMILNNPEVFEPARYNKFKKNFAESVKRMFPLVFENNYDMYYVPPPLLAYVINLDRSILNNHNDLVNLLKFIDQVNPEKRSGLMKLRTSREGNAVQTGTFGNHFNQLLLDIYRIVNRIVYSRIFAKASSDAM